MSQPTRKTIQCRLCPVCSGETQMFSVFWVLLTHSIAVEQEDAMSIFGFLQTHVERMNSITVQLILQMGRKRLEFEFVMRLQLFSVLNRQLSVNERFLFGLKERTLQISSLCFNLPNYIPLSSFTKLSLCLCFSGHCAMK